MGEKGNRSKEADKIRAHLARLDTIDAHANQIIAETRQAKNILSNQTIPEELAPVAQVVVPKKEYNGKLIESEEPAETETTHKYGDTVLVSSIPLTETPKPPAETIHQAEEVATLPPVTEVTPVVEEQIVVTEKIADNGHKLMSGLSDSELLFYVKDLEKTGPVTAARIKNKLKVDMARAVKLLDMLDEEKKPKKVEAIKQSYLIRKNSPDIPKDRIGMIKVGMIIRDEDHTFVVKGVPEGDNKKYWLSGTDSKGNSAVWYPDAEELADRIEERGKKIFISEPEATPTPAEPVPVEETDREKSPLTLEEIIAEAIRELAIIDKEDQIDDILDLIEEQEEKLRKTTFGKGGVKERIDMLKTKLDRIEYPFKWFIIDGLGRKNLRAMFGDDKKSAEIVNEDVFEENLDGKLCQFWDVTYPPGIVEEKDNAVMFSSNGFYIKLINKNEVKTKEGIDIQDPEAKYDLISPEGDILSSEHMPFERARTVLQEQAQFEQERLLAEFESQNSTS